ncbi:MAG: NuoM family protein, partial [Flammeovirgaceae bacterium]
MELINSHILSFLIFMPLVAAGAVLLAPSLAFARVIAMAAALLGFLGGLHVWYWFDGSSAALQFVESYEWIPSMGIKYIVGVDGLSLLLVVLTTFLMPLVLLSQWHIEDGRQKAFISLLLALQSGMIGALVAMDLVFFYVFWEAMLIPMYFIIGVWGGKRRIYAATKFVLYTVIGSLLMLAAAVLLYFAHFRQTGVYSTSLLDLYQVKLPFAMQTWMFAAFAVAFAIKVPMWPFHTWLPDAHVEASTPVSTLLAGVLLKLGTYGLLRFGLGLLPEAWQAIAPFLAIWAVVSVIYGCLTAITQKDMKKMVAYSSVGHMGYIILALSTATPLSLVGATFQMVSHGLISALLFILVGIVYKKTGTRNLDSLNGLLNPELGLPVTGSLMILAAMASAGTPGMMGFIAEFMIFRSSFAVFPVQTILCMLGTVLTAVYFLIMIDRVFFGRFSVRKDGSDKIITSIPFA